jgi:hypothetical protein
MSKNNGRGTSSTRSGTDTGRRTLPIDTYLPSTTGFRGGASFPPPPPRGAVAVVVVVDGKIPAEVSIRSRFSRKSCGMNCAAKRHNGADRVKDREGGREGRRGREGRGGREGGREREKERVREATAGVVLPPPKKINK